MTGNYFGPFGNTLEASDSTELQQKLERVDLTVPRRTKGRSSVDRERYCIVRYLEGLERARRLRFPVEVERPSQDPPDFYLTTGSERRGIEVTEAGSEEHQRAATELEKAPPGSVLEGTEIRKPGESLKGRGWAGDEPEREWTKQVLRVIRKKTDQLRRYPTSKDPVDLLIYDNSGFATLTAWSVDELPERLAKAVQEFQAERPENPHFDRYSVLRDRVLLHDVTGTSELLPVPARPSTPPLLPITRLGVSEEELRRFSREHHIRKLAFFGSIQRKEDFGPASDVDVLVEFEPGQPVGLIRMAGIERKLSELLGRKVDLRTVPELSRYFREDVMRHSEPVYVAG